MISATQGLSLWYLVAVAAMATWVVAVVTTLVVSWCITSVYRRIMADFGKVHPGECYLCTVYCNVMGHSPPKHRCDDWRTKHDRRLSRP
jgi:hypothetical protein